MATGACPTDLNWKACWTWLTPTLAFPQWDHPFTSVQSNVYWSSSTVAGAVSNAWYVILYYGYVESQDKAGGKYYVWPVRDGQ